MVYADTGAVVETRRRGDGRSRRGSAWARRPLTRRDEEYSRGSRSVDRRHAQLRCRCRSTPSPTGSRCTSTPTPPRSGSTRRRRHGSGRTSAPIPHWLYFTPLRKHQPEWFQFVVWSSLIGTITALMGVVIAIWMLSPRKRYRYAGAPTMHSVSRLEALAHDHRPVLRRHHRDVGVQRPAVDGAVSDHRQI